MIPDATWETFDAEVERLFNKRLKETRVNLEESLRAYYIWRGEGTTDSDLDNLVQQAMDVIDEVWRSYPPLKRVE